MNWIIVRNVATDELRVARVKTGFTCTADPSVRWAGWWESERDARKALASKDPSIKRQLYGKPRGIDGTPGPEALTELFRF